jgi:hypothetical protein
METSLLCVLTHYGSAEESTEAPEREEDEAALQLLRRSSSSTPAVSSDSRSTDTATTTAITALSIDTSITSSSSSKGKPRAVSLSPIHEDAPVSRGYYLPDEVCEDRPPTPFPFCLDDVPEPTIVVADPESRERRAALVAVTEAANAELRAWKASATTTNTTTNTTNTNNNKDKAGLEVGPSAGAVGVGVVSGAGLLKEQA